jgi:hypothetical protein
MRRIFTFIAAITMVATFQNATAQTTCTASQTNPNPPGGFGTGTNITTANGFTSTGQTTPFTFQSGATTSITSPIFYFNQPQTTIDFAVQLTPANGANPTFTPTIEIISGSSATVFSSCTTPTVELNAGQPTQQIFFSISPATAFPGGTNFQIRLTFATGPRDIQALTFAIESQAIRAPAGAALPVRISSFNIRKEGGGARLTWNVDAEENVTYYQIERSGNGSAFSKVGTVNAAGLRSYSFLDASPLAEGHYRIRAVDQDGKYSLSIIMTLRGSNTGVVLRAFPSPALNNVTLEHGAAVGASRISITTQDGRVVRSLAPAVGAQRTSIDVSSLSAGMYLIRYEAGNGDIESTKMVKQ